MRPLLYFFAIAAVASASACQSPAASGSTSSATTPAVPSATPTPLPAPSSASHPSKFRAGGTEPFWGVDVDGEQLRYTTPENMQGTRLNAKPVVSAHGIRYAGTQSGKPFSLEIREAGGTCSDGMSEIEYRYTASFAYDGRQLKGCAKTLP